MQEIKSHNIERCPCFRGGGGLEKGSTLLLFSYYESVFYSEVSFMERYNY